VRVRLAPYLIISNRDGDRFKFSNPAGNRGHVSETSTLI